MNNPGNLDQLLTGIGECLAEEDIRNLTTEQLERIAYATAQFIRTLFPTQKESQPLSRKVTAEELPAEYGEVICRMASSFTGKCSVDLAEALNVLRQYGFEVRRFRKTTFVPDDPRLLEAPNEWIFQRARSGNIPASSIESQDLFMICEIRPKPDVIDTIRWVQRPYDADPFRDDLVELHKQLDVTKPGKPVPLESRAAFSFRELREHVLPRLSRKAGICLQCMPAMYACILANEHPKMSDGHSTEWREEVSDSHAIISGRSDRGPIHHLYYDAQDDPYINRGFRLCAILGPAHPTSMHSLPSIET